VEDSTNLSADRIKHLIHEFITTSPQNTLDDQGGEPAWDDALVGFASGADPIWQQYKEYIGPFHWTPWEVYSQHCPGEPAGAPELTVIAWVLPQRPVVRQANRRSKKYPAEAWARARIFGEAFNAALRRHLVETLTRMGRAAVAPMLVSNWTVVQSARFSYASSWSERHAAHAAGLGTFGLCDGLITARGKAIRAGSVVTRMVMEPTPRAYADHRAYCLFFAKGT
jgi:epoxyqueuosine reductase